MPDILKHKDYRDFIKVRLESLKKKNVKLTFQVLSEELSTTRSYMKLVIDKDRHLNQDLLLPLAKTLQLTDFETQYFIFLYLYTNSHKPESKEYFNTILKSFSAYSRNTDTTLTPMGANWAKKSIFRNWACMAIVALSKRSDYEHSVKWVHEILGGSHVLTQNQVKEAFKILEDHQLIAETEDGPRPAVNEIIDDVTPFDVEDFQRFKTGLSRAAQMIDLRGKTPIHRPNRFQVYCLSLSHDDADEVMKLYDQLKEKLLNLSKKTKKHERLIFVSNSAFAISEDR